MKKIALIVTVLLVCVISLAWAKETEEIKDVAIEGTIQGLNCISTGKTCPVGKEDPLIATERFFVLYTKDADFYMVPNLDRAIMARHINEIVRISGKLHVKYKSINADKFEVLEEGKWVKTWPFPMENYKIGVGGFPSSK